MEQRDGANRPALLEWDSSLGAVDPQAGNKDQKEGNTVKLGCQGKSYVAMDCLLCAGSKNPRGLVLV